MFVAILTGYNVRPQDRLLRWISVRPSKLHRGLSSVIASAIRLQSPYRKMLGACAWLNEITNLG